MNALRLNRMIFRKRRGFDQVGAQERTKADELRRQVSRLERALAARRWRSRSRGNFAGASLSQIAAAPRIASGARRRLALLSLDVRAARTRRGSSTARH